MSLVVVVHPLENLQVGDATLRISSVDEGLYRVQQDGQRDALVLFGTNYHVGDATLRFAAHGDNIRVFIDAPKTVPVVRESAKKRGMVHG